jgi:glutathione S-transferase
MITLYHDRRSYSSQKVQVYLSEKGIQWESHPINLLKQEHIIDETYKCIHPRGIVPALRDGETIICNSTEIMEYISTKYLPKSDIFFNLSLSEAVHNFCKKDELLHDPHIRILSYYNLWMAGERSAEENSRLLVLAAKHPDKTRGEFLAKAVRGKITSDEIKLANTAITSALSDMEEKLANNSQSDFIFGEEYTMADTVCTVRLFRFGRLNVKIELLKDQYPYTAAFYERVKQRNSFSELQI